MATIISKRNLVSYRTRHRVITRNPRTKSIMSVADGSFFRGASIALAFSAVLWAGLIALAMKVFA